MYCLTYVVSVVCRDSIIRNIIKIASPTGPEALIARLSTSDLLQSDKILVNISKVKPKTSMIHLFKDPQREILGPCVRKKYTYSCTVTTLSCSSLIAWSMARKATSAILSGPHIFQFFCGSFRGPQTGYDSSTTGSGGLRLVALCLETQYPVSLEVRPKKDII